MTKRSGGIKVMQNEGIDGKEQRMLKFNYAREVAK